VRRARWLKPGNLILATRPRGVILADVIILTMPVLFVFAVVLRQLLDKAFGYIQRVDPTITATTCCGKDPADQDAI
jgi:hypothetical protein